MSIERSVRLIAGSLVVISLALGYFVSGYWLLLTLFVGINLFQSALTGFCPAEMILRHFGVGSPQRSASKDVSSVGAIDKSSPLLR